MRLFIFFIALFYPLLASAHAGRTDANSGHTNKKTGHYHYHFSSSSQPKTKKRPSITAGKNHYQREDFGGWADNDRDCLTTRHELLQARSLTPVQFSEHNSCLVTQGLWLGKFSGEYFYSASDVDIDHIIPLKWAFEHGAKTWDSSLKQQFANDPKNLLIVLDRLNQSKGAKPPSLWMPPNQSYRCEYLSQWQQLLLEYDLTMWASERRIFNKMLNACATES